MSQGSERNPDDVNTTAIFTIGLAGAAVIFASMIGLEAFYYNDIKALEHERASTGADIEYRSSVAAQNSALKEPGTGKVAIDRAVQLVIDDAKAGKGTLVPAIGAHDQPTIPPKYGTPEPGVKWPPDPVPVEGDAPVEGAPANGTAAPSGEVPPAAPAPAAPAAPAAPVPATPAAPAAPGVNAP